MFLHMNANDVVLCRGNDRKKRGMLDIHPLTISIQLSLKSIIELMGPNVGPTNAERKRMR
jgi:hypothetical protein